MIDLTPYEQALTDVVIAARKARAVARAREWRRLNGAFVDPESREVKAQTMRGWRANNRARIEAYGRSYYEANAERRRAHARERYKETREERKAYSRQYRADNPEAIREANRAYYAANKERITARKREQRAARKGATNVQATN